MVDSNIATTRTARELNASSREPAADRMVYGIGGELVAEYNATSSIPAVTSPSKEYGYRGGQMLIVAESTTVVKWLVQDHLGSTRMEIGLSGAANAVTRHDYLPFGEELTNSTRVGNGYGGASASSIYVEPSR